MREELRQEIQRRISESFDRARQAEPKIVVDEERMKQQRDREAVRRLKERPASAT
jgi:hypothetical protein